MALRGPKIALNAPNVIKVAPKWPLNAPERIKTTQKCSKMTAIGPKTTPNPLKFMGFLSTRGKNSKFHIFKKSRLQILGRSLQNSGFNPKTHRNPPEMFRFCDKKVGKESEFPISEEIRLQFGSKTPQNIEFQRSKKGGKPPKSAFFGNFSQSYQNHLEPPQFKRD